MLPLRIVHIDDDPSALESMRTMLEGLPQTEYLSGFATPEQGVAFIKEHNADILFLDIEMPGHDGLWVANQLKEIAVDIIFYTSHTGYALQAFDACAIDYLVKPVNEEKLDEILEKYRNRKVKDLSHQQEQIQEYYSRYIEQRERPARIFVNLNGQIIIVKLEEVLYFQASDNYTFVMLIGGRKHIVSKGIKTYEEALRYNTDFLRIHRSYIVNKHFVEMIERDSQTRRIRFTLLNGEMLPSAFKTKEEVMELLAK